MLVAATVEKRRVVPTLVLERRANLQETLRMFLRAKNRFKDGKLHRYWSIVESQRLRGGRVIQRQVLYLGEINDSQKEAWCKDIEVLDESKTHGRQIAIFSEDRCAPEGGYEVVQIR